MKSQERLILQQKNQPQRMPTPLSEEEVLLRSQALLGCSIGELAKQLNFPLPENIKREKGIIGQLLELALGCNAFAGSRPDLTTLNIELKTIPLGPKGRPLESTFCCAIDLKEAQEALFETSRLAQKIQKVLFFAIGQHRQQPLAQRQIIAYRLWQPSKNQWQQLQADWELLMGHIAIGFAGHLQARLGEILQVRPKAANSQSRCLGPSDIGLEKTLPLGFYLRARFTATLFDNNNVYFKDPCVSTEVKIANTTIK